MSFAGVQVGFLRNGKIIGSEFFPMQAAINDDPREILSGFVTQFYEDAAVVPPPLSRRQSSAPIARTNVVGRGGEDGAAALDVENLKIGLPTIQGIGGVPGAPATRTSTR